MTVRAPVIPEPLTRLPVYTVLPRLLAALAERRTAVLQAPPGAGKSTGVPLALLAADWLAGQRLLMLEPRRLAARAVAERMAALLGERPGETVGYRMRLDTRVGPRTRIEVVTEGILTRQLQHDPELAGTGLVVFDEFHERNLQADLGLSLLLDVRAHLRPELRLLMMSATLDAQPLAALLGGAPVVTAEGLSHPVETTYLSRPAGPDLIAAVCAACERALATQAGDVLVFLPGAGEIRRAAAALAEAARRARARITPLYGDLPPAEQNRALAPAPAGERKLVLATNIAETSLTIEGVRVVVDAGLERRPHFDPRSGLSRLETVQISQASADQRRGRAGRLGPGACYRLWTEAQHRQLRPRTPPEIEAADLAPLALELACWGASGPEALAWLDPPPPGAWAQARELLTWLGALDADGRVTAHGRDMAELGAHPRLAHLLLEGRRLGSGATACALAALLSERDVLAGTPELRDADLRSRLELLASRSSQGAAGTRGGLGRVRRALELFARRLQVSADAAELEPAAAGRLLALAYPDRIARARAGGRGRYLLSGGRGAYFAEPQALAGAELLVVAELDAGQREARIHLAAPLSAGELEAALGDLIRATDSVAWDARAGAVVSQRQTRLGALVLSDAPLPAPDPGAVASALLDGIRSLGLECLPWDRETRQWQARVALVRRVEPEAAEPWPDLSDAALLATLDRWLSPWLGGCSRREHLARLDLRAALRQALSWAQQQRLAELAPTHLEVPSGSRIALDYLAGEVPVLAVRLQEVFGLIETPRIAGGRVPVLLQLLSPARRPVQTTRDLRSFWERTYAEVRRELKGRYPKHYWPEDPYQAVPTRRVRPR